MSAEVDLPDALHRTGELEKLPYVKECSVHGPLLHVLLESEKDLELFEQYTGTPATIISPSLEDVFISLAGQAKRQVS